MKRAVVWLLGLPLLGGCSVRTEDESAAEPTANECSKSDECGEEGHCIAGRCEALEGRLSTVLFEVTAPGSSVSDDFAGLSFLQTRSDVPLVGGSLELALGDVAEVAGVIEAPPRGRQACEYRFYEVPLRVSLTPTERLLGLPATVYTAVAYGSGQCGSDELCLRTTSFGLRIPPGEYEIHIQSAPPSDPQDGVAPEGDLAPLCSVVPQLYRRVQIDSGQVDVPLVMPEPLTVLLTVHSALDAETGAPELGGWVVDLLDPQSGKRLSASSELGEANLVGIVDDLAEYQVELEYSPVVEDEEVVGQELVRLAPPEQVVAPAVLMERAALELFTDAAVIDQLVPLPHSIELEGRVEQETTEPLQATVTLEATELDFLEPGTLASYQRTAETDADGKFTVQLLPGSYRVVAVPPLETQLAVFEVEWEVAAEPRFQAGRTITLVEGSRLIGRVLSPSNQPVAGANALAVASPSSRNATALQAALGEAPFVPRASSAITDERGEFELYADPGSVDVSIRPLAATGFAWLVRPAVPVNVPGNVDLLDMPLPLPVAYRGHVTVLDGVVLPEALIRAYVLLGPEGYTSSRDDPDNPAEAVVQVAEARADGRGRFELLLPQDLRANTPITR
jgi:hypothetical protein